MKATTHLCDVGYHAPHFVAVHPDGKWCGHKHATRQDARDCNTRTLIDRESIAYSMGALADALTPIPGLVGGALAAALDKMNDNWLPANGGTETAFRTRMGRTLLYCWQPSTGKHAYLDCGTDIILTDEEARFALSTF